MTRVNAALREAAEREQKARRDQLKIAADAEFDKPVTTPLVAGREMARAIGPEVAIVDEAPATFGALRAFLSTESTRQYSFARGGALGWGMPAAVGFSLGIDRAPVVSIVGDGAALYSPQALWTAAHERLPVTFVVINNREYNILKRFMRSQPHYASARAIASSPWTSLTQPSIFWRLPRLWASPPRESIEQRRLHRLLRRLFRPALLI